MNISKAEQRTLHALAQGGRIQLERDDRGKAVEAVCLTRDGLRLADCTLAVWRKLKRRGLFGSRDSGPYRIARGGLIALRPAVDNRVDQRRW